MVELFVIPMKTSNGEHAIRGKALGRRAGDPIGQKAAENFLLALKAARSDVAGFLKWLQSMAGDAHKAVFGLQPHEWPYRVVPRMREYLPLAQALRDRADEQARATKAAVHLADQVQDDLRRFDPSESQIGIDDIPF